MSKDTNAKYKFGFSRPWIAKYNYDEMAGTITYSDGFKCGEGANTNVTPSYVSEKLHGDNTVVEEVTEFSSAAVTLGVTKMPLVAGAILFGHAVSGTNEKSFTGDIANYVGYGFTVKNTDGTYDACVLPKVKFQEGADAYETKGSSIVFKKPELSGNAYGRNTDGEWREKEYNFATEALAEEWIKTKLGIVAQVAAPTTSVEAGTYTEEKSVVLTSTTPSAVIYYTTNGTTPSATNGETYNNAITIAESCMLRAVATASGMKNSEELQAEYIISE